MNSSNGNKSFDAIDHFAKLKFEESGGKRKHLWKAETLIVFFPHLGSHR